MLFNSINYLLFFPIVVLVFFIVPTKIRYIWLLVASYFFYMSWNAKYGILILSITCVSYVCGILLTWITKKKFLEKNIHTGKLLILSISLIINFGFLFYFKYANFTLHSLIRLTKYWGFTFHIPTFDIMLPVGISFFTFQAVGYTIDVYRNEIDSEKNFFRYALFVAFFPQLVAGPIERSKNLLTQLKVTTQFDAKRARSGLLTIAYGLFLKVVIADNIAVIVDPIYAEPGKHLGGELIIATVLFAFQIYCDFNGYTKIAIGSAEVLGYRLMNNFNAPYLAGSVRDFWRRWHISLTTWFRDYLYIPLGGNRVGTLRKELNIFFVFLCSGLWHGAAWHFVAWGLGNGLCIVVEDVCSGWAKRISRFLGIDTTKGAFKILQIIYTFIVVDILWLLFRAPSLRSALNIFKKCIHDFNFGWFINLNFLTVFPMRSFIIIIFSLLFLMTVDILKYLDKNVKYAIIQQQIIFRWTVYIGIFILIIFWGIYGTEYKQTEFIYFQF